MKKANAYVIPFAYLLLCESTEINYDKEVAADDLCRSVTSGSAGQNG